MGHHFYYDERHVCQSSQHRHAKLARSHYWYCWPLQDNLMLSWCKHREAVPRRSYSALYDYSQYSADTELLEGIAVWTTQRKLQSTETFYGSCCDRPSTVDEMSSSQKVLKMMLWACHCSPSAIINQCSPNGTRQGEIGELTNAVTFSMDQNSLSRSMIQAAHKKASMYLMILVLRISEEFWSTCWAIISRARLKSYSILH